MNTRNYQWTYKALIFQLFKQLQNWTHQRSTSKATSCLNLNTLANCTVLQPNHINKKYNLQLFIHVEKGWYCSLVIKVGKVEISSLGSRSTFCPSYCSCDHSHTKLLLVQMHFFFFFRCSVVRSDFCIAFVVHARLSLLQLLLFQMFSR